jgi:hypothetical protein
LGAASVARTASATADGMATNRYVEDASGRPADAGDDEAGAESGADTGARTADMAGLRGVAALAVRRGGRSPDARPPPPAASRFRAPQLAADARTAAAEPRRSRRVGVARPR